jgi:acetyltransferase-like isoleucine patch superfamily enzyme
MKGKQRMENATKETTELATQVRIGHRVWIGGGTLLCPDAIIGDDTTIDAGSRG